MGMELNGLNTMIPRMLQTTFRFFFLSREGRKDTTEGFLFHAKDALTHRFFHFSIRLTFMSEV